MFVNVGSDKWLNADQIVMFEKGVRPGYPDKGTRIHLTTNITVWVDRTPTELRNLLEEACHV